MPAELVLLLPAQDDEPSPALSPEPSQAATQPPASSGEADAPPFVVIYLHDPSRGDGDPTYLSIPAASPGLERSMRRELQSAYVLQSWNGVDQFAAGVFGLRNYSDFLNANGLKAKSLGGPKTGEAADELLRAAVAADRRPLWDAFERERKALRARVEERRQALQKAAVDLGLAHAKRCRALLVDEATRYLSLAEPAADSARQVLAGGRGDIDNQGILGLRGPDAELLRRALKRLQPLFHEARDARRDVLAATAAKIGTIGSALTQVPVMNFLALAPLLPYATGAADDEKARLLRRQLGTSEAFAAQYAPAAAAMPILFRLIDEDPDNERACARAVTSVLQYAWQACGDFERDLSDGDPVWTLPTLMERTVQERFARDLDFTERVASDELDAREREIHPFEAVNLLISAFDVMLVAVPVPPVQLAMMLLSTAAGAAEMAETWVRESSKRHSARAALDPSLALGTPTSPLSLLAQAVMLAVGVLPVPGLAAEVKAWRVEAATQARAATAASKL